MHRAPRAAGFTLIELVAVTAVLIILGFIIEARVGDLRADAYNTSARALEKEFSQGVEELTASGTGGAAILGPLQLIASTGTLISTGAGDPEFMGLDTTIYRMSSPASTNPNAVSGLFNQLNNWLALNHCGGVLGAIDPGLLAYYNFDLLVLKDAGGTTSTILLKLSRP